MSLLSDEEVTAIRKSLPAACTHQEAIRATESAILDKMKAQEPVAKIVVTTSSRYKKGTINVTSYCDIETEFKPHETVISEMFLYPHPLPPDDVVRDLEDTEKLLVLVANQRDELLAAAEAIEIDAEECLDFDEFTAMLVPIDTYHKLMEAIASVKGSAA